MSMSRERIKRVDMNRKSAIVGGMKEKICIACGKSLPATTEYFRADGRRCASGKPVRGGLRAACRSCLKLRDQKYHSMNAEACREYQRQHLREGDTRTKRREQQRRRMQLPVNRIKNNLFRRLNHAIACAVKHAPTYELVGCTPDQLKAHLEAAFLPGMTWENYGKGGWHIDHVMPCAAFDLTKESEQRKCFHYSNLNPLWGRDNMSKGKKVASRAPCSCSQSASENMGGAGRDARAVESAPRRAKEGSNPSPTTNHANTK